MPNTEKPEQLPSGKWSYAGLEFSSEEAALSFQQSRDEEPSFFSRVWETKTGKWLVVGVALIVGLWGISLVQSSKKPTTATTADYRSTSVVSLSAEQLDAFAFLINSNGQLCARALSASKIDTDRYEIKCKKVRDPDDEMTSIHVVNMKTGRTE